MESDVAQRDHGPLLLLISQQLSQVLRRQDEQETRFEQLHQKLDRAVALETQYQVVVPEARESAPRESDDADDTTEWLTDLFHAWCCGCGACYSLV